MEGRETILAKVKASAAWHAHSILPAWQTGCLQGAMGVAGRLKWGLFWWGALEVGAGVSSLEDKAEVTLKGPFVLSEVDLAKQKSKPGLFLTLFFVQTLNRCFKGLVRELSFLPSLQNRWHSYPL